MTTLDRVLHRAATAFEAADHADRLESVGRTLIATGATLAVGSALTIGAVYVSARFATYLFGDIL